MKFFKYPSIDNVDRIKTINEIIEQGFAKEEWVATNKIHGANFSFFCDNNSLRAGKRTSFLAEDGIGLYNSQVIFDKYKTTVENIYRYLKNWLVFESIILYGEFFGGTYPHEDVKRLPEASTIQKGVYYCPHNDFLLFDIVLVQKDGFKTYLDIDQVIDIGTKHNIPTVEILYRGKFEDMITLNPVFEDPTYKQFNLPQIEDNESEGFVLRPTVTHFFGNGARVILKNKNKTFMEKVAVKKNKVVIAFPDEAKNILETGISYITENRLRNVLSHGHKVTQKDFGKLLGLLSKDIHEELLRDFKDEISDFDKSVKKQCSKTFGKEIANFIRPHFQNIIDGEF